MGQLGGLGPCVSRRDPRPNAQWIFRYRDGPVPQYTIDSLRKTIADLEASSLATIESLEESIESLEESMKSLEESIVQKDLIIANLSLQIENIGAGPVALPTEVPTAGPIAKQEKTSKKSKR